MTSFVQLSAAALLLGLSLPAAAQDADQPADQPERPSWSAIEFTAIDTNGDGSLSREELSARAAARLGQADGNGDGTLQRDEIVAVMPAPSGALVRLFAPDPAEARADALLERLGVEGDSVEITVLAERHVNALLSRADRNFDGAVSEEEAEAADSRRGRGRGGHGRGGGDGNGDGNGDGDGRDRF